MTNVLITLFLCGDVMLGRSIDQVMPYSCEPILYEQYVRDPRSGDLVELRMVPHQIHNFRLHRASAEDAQWLADALDRESDRFGARVTLRSDRSFSLSWE